ncbi:MAG TPA: hypothetical protein VF787_03265 [Thermoanaerobaculia bacterium]
MTQSPQRPRQLVRNASDADQVKNAEKVLALRKEQADVDLRELLETSAGRRVLWTLIHDECGMFEPMMVTSSEVYARAALHDWASRLIKWIQRANPEAWIQMQIEHAKREAFREDAPPTKED